MKIETEFDNNRKRKTAIERIGNQAKLKRSTKFEINRWPCNKSLAGPGIILKCLYENLPETIE